MSTEWDTLEASNQVQIKWVLDTSPDHSWIDQDCFDDEYRKDYWHKVEREGIWGCVGEYKCPCCHSWLHGDSIWGCIGQDDVGYLDQIKSETIKELRKAQQK